MREYFKSHQLQIIETINTIHILINILKVIQCSIQLLRVSIARTMRKYNCIKYQYSKDVGGGMGRGGGGTRKSVGEGVI